MDEPDTVLIAGANGDTHEVLKHGTSGRRIESVYAVLSVDEDGGEGIMGFQVRPPNGPWMPLISSDLEKIEGLAERHGKAVGEGMNMKIVLAEFTTRREVRTVHEPS